MPRPSLLLAALVLAACGCQAEDTEPADGPAPDQAEIRAALAAQFAGDHPGTRETAEGRCFAQKLTASVSPQELRSAGVLDASYDVVTEAPPLPADVAGEWADAQMACTDFVAASTRAQVKVTHGELDVRVYASCLRARVPQHDIRAAVAASLAGHFDAPEVAALSAAQSACAKRAKP